MRPPVAAPPDATKTPQRREVGLLITLGLGAALALLFWRISSVAMTGDGWAFDAWLLRSFRQPGDLAQTIGPRALLSAARDVTALGSFSVVLMFGAIAAGFLLLGGLPLRAAMVLASVGGGALVSALLKDVFERSRPDIVPRLADVSTASFPSSHAMMGAIAWLTFGALLARLVQGRWLKTYVILCAILLVLAIGASRVFLGVHWPSDVMAGWIAGAFWASLCWLVAGALERRPSAVAAGPGDEGADKRDAS